MTTSYPWHDNDPIRTPKDFRYEGKRWDKLSPEEKARYSSASKISPEDLARLTERRLENLQKLQDQAEEALKKLDHDRS